MKLILLTLITSILMAETHHFKEVNFNGTTLKNVTLIINNNSFNIWYQNKLLKDGKYMIISCKAKEGFCLIKNESYYNWINKRK